MSQNSSSPLPWIVGLLILALALYFWKFTLLIGGALGVLGAIAWAAYALGSKSGRSQAAFARHDYATGLALLQERGDDDQLVSALRFKLPFPSEETETRMVEAVRQLIALREAARDPANPDLPAPLREDIVRRTEESLASLWPLCQKLSLLARAKVGSDRIEEQVGDLLDQLVALTAKAEATRRQLAHVTLETSDLEVNVATEQVAAIGWQVEEMRKLDAALGD